MTDTYKQILKLIDTAHIERIYWSLDIADGIIDEAISMSAYYDILEKRYEVIVGAEVDEEIKTQRRKLDIVLKTPD